ncbi:response regulator [Caballeronia grimmiae]|uniref:response regulator n=1 Tax=Caballeronia grimmiae TaxID=1071679 RepID=UPI0038BB4746
MPSVLLVDDDVDALVALQLAFEAHDYEVILAQDGEAALSQAARRLPDVIVTDLEMPYLDGAGLCQRLKCYPSLATVPVVLISGAVPPSSLSPLWNAFLSKPVDFWVLAEIIEQLPVRRLGPESQRPRDEVPSRGRCPAHPRKYWV